jgi:hypothetical protein
MTIDRLSPIGTLTPDERAQARLTLERDPSLLDDLVMAALLNCDDGETTATLMLATIREVQRCAES